MEKIIKKIKNSKGYIGIEVILIAGMIIAFGVLTITYFRESATDITEESLNKISNSIEYMHVNTDYSK